jgi:CRP-like cAMP-binding protein
MAIQTHSQFPERIRLLMKLESIAELSSEEREALFALPMRILDVTADTDIVREGDRPSECCLLLAGFACRYKAIGNGRRQIISFQTPGDIPDLQSLFVDAMDHAIATLARSRLAFIRHQDIRELIRCFPHLGAVLWRETLIDAAIFREWMVGLGRRNACTRIAHLVCEMHMRLAAVGLAHADSFDFPVTQIELADATGLSPVHVNRTLMELRRAGKMTFRGSTVIVPDWNQLRATGEFDPAYLQQRNTATLSDIAA